MAAAEAIHLAAFDLDGTLLNSQLVIAPGNLALLRAVADRGIHLALASGRTRMSIKPHIEAIGRPAAAIACNGARICFPGADGEALGEVCAERSLPHEVLSELIEFCRANELMHNLYVGDDIVGPIESEQGPMRYYRDLYAQRTGVQHRLADTREWADADSAKFLIVCAPDQRDRLYVRMRAQFGSRTDMVKTNPEYLEFLTPGVHKGWGLQALCAGLGVDLAATLALGDGDNDVQLLQAAGYGVCMANGSKACRAAANYITPEGHDGAGIQQGLAWAGLTAQPAR
ncbi:MAG: Cof-type HAD-IIB family hydrolase [Planctomycetota bacterium]